MLNRVALRLSLTAIVATFGATNDAYPQNKTISAAEATAPGVVMTDHIQLKAKIEEIDRAQRQVELKGDDGNSLTIQVGPGAKNFDQLSVGDQVQVDLYASTAISLSKSGEAPSAAAVDTVQLAAPGEKPGGIIASTRETSATVNAIDQKNRWIVVTGPRGNTVGLRVGDTIENLGDIKVGDRIVLRYTEAFALRVDKS